MRILPILLATIAATLLPTLPTMAGDAAELNILGFSKDGGIFAFEEYGVQDGSGFPYANRYYIDTATDTFLKGTPIRIRIEDDVTDLDVARKQARDKGQFIVSDAELEANRGFTAGYNPITEVSADPYRMVVNPRPIFPTGDLLEVRLDELPMNGQTGMESCNSQGDINGFRLMRIEAEDGGATKLLHQDKSIPQSRGCPNGYRIGAIQTYDINGLSTYAVLIAVRQYGFEGPDYRWIAVTARP